MTPLLRHPPGTSPGFLSDSLRPPSLYATFCPYFECPALRFLCVPLHTARSFHPRVTAHLCYGFSLLVCALICGILLWTSVTIFLVCASCFAVFYCSSGPFSYSIVQQKKKGSNSQACVFSFDSCCALLIPLRYLLLLHISRCRNVLLLRLPLTRASSHRVLHAVRPKRCPLLLTLEMTRNTLCGSHPRPQLVRLSCMNSLFSVKPPHHTSTPLPTTTRSPIPLQRTRVHLLLTLPRWPTLPRDAV